MATAITVNKMTDKTEAQITAQIVEEKMVADLKNLLQISAAGLALLLLSKTAKLPEHSSTAWKTKSRVSSRFARGLTNKAENISSSASARVANKSSPVKTTRRIISSEKWAISRKTRK